MSGAFVYSGNGHGEREALRCIPPKASVPSPPGMEAEEGHGGRWPRGRDPCGRESVHPNATGVAPQGHASAGARMSRALLLLALAACTSPAEPAPEAPPCTAKVKHVLDTDVGRFIYPPRCYPEAE